MKYLILTVLLASIFFSSCSTNDSNKKKEEKIQTIIRPVIVINPIVNNNENTRSFNAISKADQQIKLSFKVKGNISHFNLKIGDFIKKGELIASLDNSMYKIKEKQSSYSLVEANAKLKNAKQSYDRVQKLYINQNISQSELDSVKANYYSLKARVAKSKESLDFAKLQLSYTSLYAPKSGFIEETYVQKDENIDIGRPILLLSDKNIINVSVQIPENFINKINIGDKVSLSFNAIQNKQFVAKVSEVSKSANKELKSFQVIVKLLKHDKRIKAGMASKIIFSTKKTSSYILEIPSSSVLNDNQGYFVYVAVPYKDKLAKIKRKNITIGKLNLSGFEILKGLTVEDLVLKAGMSQVFEEMIVELK